MHGLAVLIVSAVAALVMAAGALVLREDEDEDEDEDDEDEDEDEQRDPSIAAILLDTLADAAAGAATTDAIILANRGLVLAKPPLWRSPSPSSSATRLHQSEEF